jgi:hypothetical protein
MVRSEGETKKQASPIVIRSSSRAMKMSLIFTAMNSIAKLVALADARTSGEAWTFHGRQSPGSLL